MVSTYLCYPGTYMDAATTASDTFDDCEPCTNDATDTDGYGFCPEYGMTAPEQSSSLAVEDGYKAEDYLDSDTPYYDSRLDSNDNFDAYSPVYLHFEWLNTGSSYAILEGLAKAAVRDNTFCEAPYVCKDDSGNGYTSGVEGDCPTDVYCPSDGETTGVDCPPGFFCLGSQYTTRLQESLDDCEVGYYCEGDNAKAACEDDKVCYTGSATSLSCEDGSLANDDGTDCDVCAKGKKCLDGVKTAGDKYKYFDDNTNYPYGRLCPAGTWSSNTGLDSSSDCKACTEGIYCVAGRKADACVAGYICLESADSPTPKCVDEDGNDADPPDDCAVEAYECPLGYYCVEGTEEPVQCPLGTFTSETGARQKEQCADCRAGYYCVYGENAKTDCP